MDQAREPLRILLAGDWRAEIQEAAWAWGLERLGHEVIPFRWCPYFQGASALGRLVGRAEYKFIVGSALWRLNLDLHRLVLSERPDALVIYRGTHVWPVTLRQIKRHLPRMPIITYNNDDPCSAGASRMLWRYYLRCLPWADANLVYRHKNIADLEELGALRVGLVRSFYHPEKHRPPAITAEDQARFGSEVLFAGHYEPDGRIHYLDALEDAGARVRLAGPEWERAPRRPWLIRQRPVRPVRGLDYVKSIACTKVALCFLSTLNSDTYTRRCFEIPAIGAFLLCQASDDMKAMFAPGKEADYFSSPEELVDKVHYYLARPDLRERIAKAGHVRVMEDGHDVVSRMREVDSVVRNAAQAMAIANLRDR
jgi:hypothetical protein